MMNLTVTEYKNIRVLTTQQIAEAYETDKKTISYNFNHNKERYKEGKHYIALEGEEKKEFLNRLEIHDGSQNAKVFYLWTEKGAFLHAKSLNTDVAWDVYDRLVDSYFNKNVESEEFSPLLRLLMNMELKQKETDKKLDDLEQKSEKQTEVIQAVKETFADTGEEDFRHWAVTVITAIANNPDYGQTKYKYQEAWGESYKRLTDKAGCNLDTLLKNARKRAKQCGASRTQLTTINKLSIIANNKRLKEIYISVLREMSMAYCLVTA